MQMNEATNDKNKGYHEVIWGEVVNTLGGYLANWSQKWALVTNIQLQSDV